MAEAKEPPLTPAQKQAVQEAKDANARKLEEKAPTTKTEMGKRFKKGGFVHNEGGIRMKRKYSEGDEVVADDEEEPEVYRSYRSTGVRVSDDTEAPIKSRPKSEARKSTEPKQTAEPKKPATRFSDLIKKRAQDAEPRRNPREIRQRQLSSVNLAKGGSVGSASKRADGCAQRGKTKGRVI